jgi:hypothetical protein
MQILFNDFLIIGAIGKQETENNYAFIPAP